jgi:hypothetical protein
MQLSQQLGLDHLPMLLDMARLELLNERASDDKNKRGPSRMRHIN